MDYYLGVAEEEGVSGEEIGAVLAVVMAVGAGKVRAQLREIRRRRRGGKGQAKGKIPPGDRSS